MGKRIMLVDGYRAVPKGVRGPVHNGLQPSRAETTSRPTASQLPKNTQSSLMPPKKR